MRESTSKHARLGRIGAAIALAAALALPAAASAATPFPGANPWVNLHFLNIAHQGGEDEVPSATMYALKSAMTEGGADMLEIDVQLTADNQLVVLHDDVYNTKSCLPALCTSPATEPTRDESQIRDLTLQELRALDAAYWFRPNTYARDYGLPDSAYPFRGVRTGAKAPPAGYTASDFRIPTLAEVMNTFPTTPINIEIKMPKSPDPVRPYRPSCSAPVGLQICDDLDLTIPTTNALIHFFNKEPYASRRDVIVVSFAQEPMEQFAAGAPQIFRAPSEAALTNYFFSGGNSPLTPDPVAFQVPPAFGAIAPPEALLSPVIDVHGNNRAIHVFTDGDDDETAAEYGRLYNLGVDGIMTSRPRALNAFLCSSGIKRPSGADRCPVAAPPPTPPKTCKKGQKLKKGKCVKPKKKRKGKKRR